MRALTLWPEWLWVIRHLGKRIENRPWKLPVWIANEPVLLHAGKRVGGGKTIQGLEWVKEMAIASGIDCVRHGESLQFGDKLLRIDDLDYGKIVGVTKFDSCSHDSTPQPWAAAGQWHWRMSEVLFFGMPIPCRGFQKLWNVPKDIEFLVFQQIEMARLTEAIRVSSCALEGGNPNEATARAMLGE